MSHPGKGSASKANRGRGSHWKVSYFYTGLLINLAVLSQNIAGLKS